MDIGTVTGIIELGAELYPEKTAFTDRSGRSYSFGALMEDSLYMLTELTRRGLDGRPAAIIGEVGYGGLAAMFGSLAAGCPFIPLHHGLSVNELCVLMEKYEVGVLFATARYAQAAETVMQRVEGLTVICDVEKRLSEKDSTPVLTLPQTDPSAPAFLFRSADNNAVILSHKNICAALAAVDSDWAAGSYTFLTPAHWGEAFDCIMGLLLPLSAGCGLVKRSDRRSVTRSISESEATALACTYPRLRSLERSLRFRSEQKRSKVSIALSNIFGRLGRIMGSDVSKRMHRQVHSLMGDNLHLIICGGQYPERDSVRRFMDWGIEVRSYYFTPECGPLALDDPIGKKLKPLAELSVLSPVRDGLGELYVGGDRVPIGYYGGRTDFPDGFPTGDVGLVTPDDGLELRGRRKTMLYGRGGEPLFPEEIAAVIRKNRYVADCTVTGRFDTRSSDVYLTAVISPDFREVSTAIGEKYSDNRLRLFFKRIIEKLEPELSHKINEFRLPDRGTPQI